MDPLGFALENFDAIGRWRTVTEAGTPVDAAGELVDGTPVDGPESLAAALLKRPDSFVTTVTEKLLTYGLGRGVEYYDAPAVRRIVREAADDDYRWSAIIAGIARSVPFQMRRGPRHDDHEDGPCPGAPSCAASARRSPLPLLDGMVPALSAMRNTAARPQARLYVGYVPNGVIMDKWTPAAEGRDFMLPQTPRPPEAVPGSGHGGERAGQRADVPVAPAKAPETMCAPPRRS